MHLQHNISLKPFNTFGIDVPAEYYVALSSYEMLQEMTHNQTLPTQRHILGGGSNVLLTRPVSGLVIHNCLKGITVEKENDTHIWLQVQAGEVWHEWVMWGIGKGFSGIENLALIPGTVGAAPIQNIGAYGVEAKETIDTVTAWHWQEKSFVTFNNNDCKFGYRESIFKNTLKDKVLITSVVFKLNKQHTFNTSYGSIGEELTRMNVSKLTPKAIADAVIAIRSSKLPDPKQIGNAGSFFKNPTISAQQFELLHTHYPVIPSYPAGDNVVKVPTGWLIEQCGWRGYRKADAGVHEKQALVLVNYHHATGAEIWQLSDDIVASVQARFGIKLEREVQVW
jgi:UDP-N-acetylmuramate dehydrogenase